MVALILIWLTLVAAVLAFTERTTAAGRRVSAEPGPAIFPPHGMAKPSIASSLPGIAQWRTDLKAPQSLQEHQSWCPSNCTRALFQIDRAGGDPAGS